MSATNIEPLDRLNFTIKPYKSLNEEPFFYFNDNEDNESDVSIISEDEFDFECDAASDAPLLLEMQNKIPHLFKDHQSLDQFFLVEDFVANNLKGLSENFLNKEFQFSNDMVLLHVTQEAFKKANVEVQELMIIILTEINSSFEHMKLLVMILNRNLLKEFEKVLNNMRTKIMSNFVYSRNFENSRAMFEGLQDVKSFLSHLVTDEFGSVLGSLSDKIIDLLYDYNQLAEDVCKFKRTSVSSLQDDASSSENFYKLNELVHYVESNLSDSSTFVEEECSVLSDILHNIKLCFKDYVSAFHNYEFDTLNTKFMFNIVSLDTHLNNQITRTFTSNL